MNYSTAGAAVENAATEDGRDGERLAAKNGDD